MYMCVCVCACMCAYMCNVFLKLCRSYCEELSMGKCKGLWDTMKTGSSFLIISPPDCETLPSPEGGDYLECFIPYNNGRSRRDINSTGT